MNQNQDEKIKQAISAWIDGEASAEEKKLAEENLKQASWDQYAKELQKLKEATKAWQDEEPSPDLRERVQKIKEREGFPMKSLIEKINPRLAGALVVTVLAVIVVTKLPEQTDKFQPIEKVDKLQNVQTPPMVMEYAKNNEPQRRQALMSLREESFSPQLSVIAASYPYSPYMAEPFNREGYSYIQEISFRNTLENPLSTFSIDVDTASYSNLRRFLNSDQMPPQDAVRIEEMINYFHYDYPKAQEGEPFSVTLERGVAPWNAKNEIILIGLKGKELETATLPPSHLVFLIDVSGSMAQPNKLPLLQSGFKKMVAQLSEKEKVAIVTYAGHAGLVLDSTLGSEKAKINQAIEELTPGGSTAGARGIEMAYEIAKKNFIPNGNNRVILATDGDFNVGVSSDAELVRLIEEKRKDGIFLTVLGFGEGNLQDAKMEQLADKGNGNYAYIDSIKEAQKVLVKELGSTLFTIAKDVKIQIEFNPAHVKSYRLIGYENRALANQDFANDKKDAGEMGAGHSVTALYEIVPAGTNEAEQIAEALKYQKTEVKPSNELITVKLRYKEPQEETSKLITKILNQEEKAVEPSENFKLATAISEFGLLLRKSEFKAQASYESVLKALQSLQSEDKEGYRAELIELVKKAQALYISSGKGIQFK